VPSHLYSSLKPAITCKNPKKFGRPGGWGSKGGGGKIKK